MHTDIKENLNNMNVIDKLNKRYASKAMNGTKIPEEKKEQILEAIRLAPSSLGFQPFKVLVVESKEKKKKIFDVAAQGQPQIPNSDFTLVFAVPTHFTSKMVDEYFENVKNVRRLKPEKLESYRSMVEDFLNKPDEELARWASKQVYIALGFGLYTAAMLDVDSVPIEGFSKEKLDEALGLKEQNLASVCIMAVGNRDEELDYNAKLPKMRKSFENLFIRL